MANPLAQTLLYKGSLPFVRHGGKANESRRTGNNLSGKWRPQPGKAHPGIHGWATLVDFSSKKYTTVYREKCLTSY